MINTLRFGILVLALGLIADRLVVNYYANKVIEHPQYVTSCMVLVMMGDLGQKMIDAKIKIEFDNITELTFVEKWYAKRGVRAGFDACFD